VSDEDFHLIDPAPAVWVPGVTVAAMLHGERVDLVVKRVERDRWPTIVTFDTGRGPLIAVPFV